MKKIYFLKSCLFTFWMLLFSLNAYAKQTDPLIGCWRFVKAVSANGIIDNTWGKNPIGYLIYSPQGVMEVQIMRKEQTSTATSLEENFFAYGGYYRIDEKNHRVTHEIETAVFPEMVGKSYQRIYHIKQNYLYLTIAESKKGQTFVWKKCHSLNA